MKEISKKIIKNRIMFQFYFNTEMFSLLPNIVILYDKDKKQLSFNLIFWFIILTFAIDRK